jgi:CDP-glycerol glycerophosphotransferase
MKQKNIHFFRRLFILLSSVPVIIISFFIRRDKNRVIFTSFLNKKYNSNSKYLFQWFIQNLKNYQSYFVVNDDDLREQLNNTIGNYFIETKTFKGKIFALRGAIWFISSFELPVGGFYLAHNRYVVHLDHGSPTKNAGFKEKRVSLLKKIYYTMIKTNISYSVAPSAYFQPIQSGFFGISNDRVLITGLPRNDQLFVKSMLDIHDITKHEGMKNILYAPTWRPSTKLWLFPFNDFDIQKLSLFLIENKINIFLRTHPYFEEEIDKKLLEIPNVYLFSGNIYDEINDYLNIFDLLITDYSNIYCDYLLLDRPIIFLPYDFESYNEEIGYAIPYDEVSPGYKPDNMNDFLNAIKESLYGNDEYKDERNRVNQLYNYYTKDNCKNFVDILYEHGILTNE